MLSTRVSYKCMCFSMEPFTALIYVTNYKLFHTSNKGDISQNLNFNAPRIYLLISNVGFKMLHPLLHLIHSHTHDSGLVSFSTRNVNDHEMIECKHSILLCRVRGDIPEPLKINAPMVSNQTIQKIL